MSGKSRQQKVKRSSKSKRKTGRPGHPPILARKPPAAETGSPVSASDVSATAPSVPPSVAQPMFHYPHISTELRTIGILAVIMLAILIVLAMVPLPW